MKKIISKECDKFCNETDWSVFGICQYERVVIFKCTSCGGFKHEYLEEVPDINEINLNNINKKV